MKGKVEAGKQYVKGKLGLDKDSAGDVRTKVKAVLLRELGPAHKREQISPILTAVQQRFSNLGVRQVMLGPERESGELPVLVEASPLAPAVLLRLARPGWTVRAGATLRFSEGIT